MNKDTLIKVLNRDNGATIYSIPEMNGLRRVFQAGETKEITFEELQKLSYIPGGMALLRENLVILDNDEAVNLILNHVEPEYSYTKNDIINLLKNGTLDELLDCLDFAPEGVKELIKAAAVELPLNDVAKRQAILEKLGFSIDNALKIKKEIQIPEEEKPAMERRVKKNVEDNTKTVRRVIK